MGRGLGVIRLAILVFGEIAMVMTLLTGQWSAAGVLFLLFAVLTPDLRKRAKLRAQALKNTSKP